MNPRFKNVLLVLSLVLNGALAPIAIVKIGEVRRCGQALGAAIQAKNACLQLLPHRDELIEKGTEAGKNLLERWRQRKNP